MDSKMHSKPMEEWTIDDVSMWLLCSGLVAVIPDIVERFQENKVVGSHLLDLSDVDLTEGLGWKLNQVQAEKLILARDFTKSMSTSTTSISHLELAELVAELKAVKLENANLDAQLVLKDTRIQELEKDLQEQEAIRHQFWHPEEVLLSMEHRHEAERRRMEERQESETKQEEDHFQEERAKEKGAKSSEDDAGAIHGGKRHFQEQEPYDIHRLF